MRNRGKRRENFRMGQNKELASKKTEKRR